MGIKEFLFIISKSIYLWILFITKIRLEKKTNQLFKKIKRALKI